MCSSRKDHVHQHSGGILSHSRHLIPMAMSVYGAAPGKPAHMIGQIIYWSPATPQACSWCWVTAVSRDQKFLLLVIICEHNSQKDCWILEGKHAPEIIPRDNSSCKRATGAQSSCSLGPGGAGWQEQAGNPTWHCWPCTYFTGGTESSTFCSLAHGFGYYSHIGKNEEMSMLHSFSDCGCLLYIF